MHAFLFGTREHELAFRTQYAELKERTLAAGPLLAGTPGTLVQRNGTGHPYWYRVFYPVPGRQAEEFVCHDRDEPALQAMRDRMELAAWAAAQVTALRKLGFQVADKLTARVLVELHNRQAFDAGLVLVGTLSYMAWLNELGISAVAARTLDVDLARGRHALKLAAPLPFLATLQATSLPFTPVPGMPSTTASTSVKLPGVQGLRVDLLTPGPQLGAVVRIPELDWSAQAVPFLDYLMERAEPGAMLAGGHCIPVRLPQAARFVWHKLYSSTQRRGFAEKAAKDRRQALTLAAALSVSEPQALEEAWRMVPPAMAAPIRRSGVGLLAEVANHPELGELLAACLERGQA